MRNYGMRLDTVFGKSMMKNAESSKMRCLLQIAAEIRTLLIQSTP